MELQTLFKRESVADQSLRPTSIILSVQNNDGARSVPGCRDLELAGIGRLENRFRRTCRFKNGEVTTPSGGDSQRTLSKLFGNRFLGRISTFANF